VLRLVLFIALAIFVARAFWRLVDSIVAEVRGEPAGRRAKRVQMARDPVCGTFVVPDHALSIADGPQRVYFCSMKCRDQYRARHVRRA
jgi:YHS domain-containing protein